MSELKDLKNGCIYLDDCIVIRKDVSVIAVIDQGVKFDHEIDMGNGWVLRSSRRHFILGHEVNVTFNFFKDSLKMFGFALENEHGRDLEQLKKKHDNFLRNLLGDPQKKNEILVAYEFAWGSITSQIDPRGGSCSIGFNWT